MGKNIDFHGSSESSNCSGSKVYEWNFGDGSALGRGQEVKHKYTPAGTYQWQLRVLQDGAVCEQSSTIVIQSGGGRSRTSTGRRTP